MTDTPKPAIEAPKKHPKPKKRPKRLIACDERIASIENRHNEHLLYKSEGEKQRQAIQDDLTKASYFDIATQAEKYAAKAQLIYVTASIAKNTNLVHVKSYAMRAEEYAKEAFKFAQQLQGSLLTGEFQIANEGLTKALQNASKCETQASRYASGYHATDMNMEC